MNCTRSAWPPLMISHKGAIRYYASQNHSLGADKGNLNGDDVHRTSYQLRCFASLHMIVSLRFSSAVASSPAGSHSSSHRRLELWPRVANLLAGPMAPCSRRRLLASVCYPFFSQPLGFLHVGQCWSQQYRCVMIRRTLHRARGKAQVDSLE
jgi:hypothetical protein